MRYLALILLFSIVPNTPIFAASHEGLPDSPDHSQPTEPGAVEQIEIEEDAGHQSQRDYHQKSEGEKVYEGEKDYEDYYKLEGENVGYNLEYRFNRLIAHFVASKMFYYQRVENIRTQIHPYFGGYGMFGSYPQSSRIQEEAESYVEYSLPLFVREFDISYRNMENELCNIVGEWFDHVIDVIEQKYLEPGLYFAREYCYNFRSGISKRYDSGREPDFQEPPSTPEQEASPQLQEDKLKVISDDHRCLSEGTIEESLSCVEREFHERSHNIDRQLTYLERVWPTIKSYLDKPDWPAATIKFYPLEGSPPIPDNWEGNKPRIDDPLPPETKKTDDQVD